MSPRRLRPAFGLLTILMLLASPLALRATPARASHTVPVTVTITTADANGDGLEGTGRGPADLYAGVRINGQIFDSLGQHQDDNDHIQPFWVFTQNVPAEDVSTSVAIQMWDHDDCSTAFCTDTGIFDSNDDQGDVDPGSDNQVDLTVNLATGRWSGDVSWPRNCSEGTGDSRVRVCWDISIDSASGDADGDGLLDGWERNGFDANGDGTIDVDLPATGANPLRKDLFLELDSEAGQAPSRASIQAMKAAFAAAPLGNPDGSSGVTLHVDMGNLVDPAAREGQPAGTCSDGIDNGGDGQIDGADSNCTYLDPSASVEDPGPTTCANGADDDGDGLTDGNDPDCLIGDNLGGGGTIRTVGACNLDNAFYAAKKNNFNTAERQWIFRYAISANLPASCSSTGGQGEIGGNDFIEFNHDGGTVMHEFGHTLNLRHGGFENNNCKPDYVSVMNYDIQFGINRAGGGLIIDYSPPRIALNGSTRGVAPLGPLVENNLNEATILDGTDNQNRFVFNDGTNTKVQNPLNAREDWNGNGNTTDSPPPAIVVNVDTADSNGNPANCANTATNSTLKGNNDWNQVSLPFRQFGDSADGAINPVTGPEPTLTELRDLQTDLNTTDLALGLTDAPDPVGAGEQLTYTLTATNNGPNPSTSTRIVDTLPADVTYASGPTSCVAAGATVTCNLGELAANASAQVTLVVNVPADLVFNNGGPKTITNSATVSNLAGPDSADGDNSASADTQVIAKADLAITGFSAPGAPTQIIIGQTLNVTLSTVAANNGPSSPIDAALTTAATASTGATVAPASDTASVAALAVGAPRTVTQTFAVGCNQPGYHAYTFDAAIAPANAADVDPDPSNNNASLTLTLDCVVPVAINIKPGDNPNSINRAEASVPLAVLTTRAGEYGLPLAFNATTINPLSVRFGPAGVFNGGGAAEIHGRAHLENSYERGTGKERTRDGDTDMVLHFAAPAAGLAADTTQACVKGEYKDPTTGQTYRFFGCDAVRIVK